MKLAIVTSYPPSKVTLNEYAYHLVKHFRQHTEVTELIILTDAAPKEVEINFTDQGCKVIVKKCWTFNSYKNIISVMKAVKQTTPDAILFNLQFMKFGDKKVAAALGLLLPLLCKIKKIPTVVLLHNILEQVDLQSAGFAKNKIIQKAYNFIGSILTRFVLSADKVAVTIHKYVDILEEKYNAKNVILIPHGTFELPEQPSFDVPDGPLKVMTFGKFGTYKKVEILIEAVEKIRSRTQANLEIIIAGTDNPNVPGYLESVKKKYQDVSQLTFTGYVEEEDVPKIFGESAMVVFPYTSTTGSSGVLHQAGSYGKAVVMPNLGDLGLLVKDEGYKGEFFDPQNMDSLADAIQKIAMNSQYRKELGKTNYEAATAFPMSRITKMYLDTFKELKKERAINSEGVNPVYIAKKTL
ncbi:glycosyltransferase [Aquimarina sp. 2201CG5-10]|uniref:glycosyltransferase n=1 Tax=Aquimarina callyspongiae TaxID=3098150 RepID=UPI002AB57EE5|nr:glycosyltransferase [Aquimarina sp. 2201CG5-10]MDY8134647.1 glycosyltransferase [Aquimarina sp. 2201CG5-10]